MRYLSPLVLTLAIAMAVPAAGAQSASGAELGSIQFPTSATGAAQAAFITGVKALHNFEFDLAAEAFRQPGGPPRRRPARSATCSRRSRCSTGRATSISATSPTARS